MARILKIKNKDGWINLLHFRKCPLCLDFQQEGCGAQAQLRQYSQMFVNFWHNFLGELQRIYREPIMMECFDSKCTAHSRISYLGEIYKEWVPWWHGSDGWCAGWYWLSKQSVDAVTMVTSDKWPSLLLIWSSITLHNTHLLTRCGH